MTGENGVEGKVKLSYASLVAAALALGVAAGAWGWGTVTGGLFGEGLATLSLLSTVLSALAVGRLAVSDPRNRGARAVGGLGIAVLTIGVAGALHALGVLPIPAAAEVWPALPSSISWALLGTALLLFGSRRKDLFGLVDVAAASALFLPTMTLIWRFYLGTVPERDDSHMSLLGALTVLLLGGAVLALNRQRRLAQWWPELSWRESLSYRLLPAVVLVPVAIGLGELRVTATGALPPEMAMALVVAIGIAVLAVLVFWNEELMLCLEAERHRELVAQEARARREAMTDPLTNLRNRRGWDAALTQADARLAHDPLDACVIVLDIDDLKAINDRLGHHEGDALLRRTAVALRECLRPEDVVARLGGDEFAALAVGVGSATRDALLKRLSDALQRQRVDASIGTALRSVSGSLSLAWHDADLAMYGQKHRRRAAGVQSPQQPAPSVRPLKP